jgi:hypothetical protein
MALKPPGKQERRIFPQPNLAGPSARQAQLIEAIGTLHGAIGDMSGLLQRMVPTVLGQKTIVLDGNGQATEQFRLPFASVAVDYFGNATLTVAAHPLQQAAPGPGVGIAKIGPGGFAVVNFKANVLSFYGTPGDVITFIAMASPQPPTGVVSPSAIVTEILGPSPAAGAAFNFTVPAGGPVFRLISARAFFTTSAAVANRFVQMQVFDAAANELARITNATGTPASSTLAASWLATVGAFQNAGTGTAVFPIPMALLQPGWQLRITAAAIDAADQFSAIALVGAQ